MDLALIRDAVVINIAVADDPPDPTWLAAVQVDYDEVVDVTDAVIRPGINWTYRGGMFTPPFLEI